MQKTWVLSLGWEDPLEKGMATHFNILAWRIPWTDRAWRATVHGSQRVRHDWAINTHTRGKREVQNRSYTSAFEANMILPTS